MGNGTGEDTDQVLSLHHPPAYTQEQLAVVSVACGKFQRECRGKPVNHEWGVVDFVMFNFFFMCAHVCMSVCVSCYLSVSDHESSSTRVFLYIAIAQAFRFHFVLV